MIITIICACIVGGMWFSTQRRIEKVNERLSSTINHSQDQILAEARQLSGLNEKIELLAKDMMELQDNINSIRGEAIAAMYKEIMELQRHVRYVQDKKIDILKDEIKKLTRKKK